MQYIHNSSMHKSNKMKTYKGCNVLLNRTYQNIHIHNQVTTLSVPQKEFHLTLILANLLNSETQILM